MLKNKKVHPHPAADFVTSTAHSRVDIKEINIT